METFWGYSWCWLLPVVFIAFMVAGCLLMRLRGGCGCMAAGPCSGHETAPGKVK